MFKKNLRVKTFKLDFEITGRHFFKFITYTYKFTEQVSIFCTVGKYVNKITLYYLVVSSYAGIENVEGRYLPKDVLWSMEGTKVTTLCLLELQNKYSSTLD